MDGADHDEAAGVAGGFVEELPRSSVNSTLLTRRDVVLLYEFAQGGPVDRGTLDTTIGAELHAAMASAPDGARLDALTAHVVALPEDIRRHVGDMLASTLADDNTPAAGSESWPLPVSIPELLAEPEEEVEYVVDGLLPAGGMSGMAAKPKVGKSSTVRYEAACIAQGIPFLGRATTQGVVLYLALEEKRGEARRQFAALGGNLEDLHIWTGQAPEKALDWLKWLVGRYRPDAVFIDTLQRFLRLDDMNDYATVSNKLEPLLELARATPTHIQWTHHASKTGGGQGDAVLGSTALFGTVDTLIEIKRDTDGRRSIETMQRYGADLPKTELRMDSNTGTVSLGEAAAELAILGAMPGILAVVEDASEPLPWKQITDKVTGGAMTLAAARRRLVDEGKLVQMGTGRAGDPYLFSIPGLYTSEQRIDSDRDQFEQRPLDQVGYGD